MLTDSDRTDLRNALRDEDAVALAYLFGSHAEGRADAASDIDVAIVTTDDDNGLRRAVDLTKTLEARVEFETRARSKYLDMRPHIEEYDRRVREALTR
jgi:predicted nucleotidyltransferase